MSRPGLLFLFYASRPVRALHSFPTRRSSDLPWDIAFGSAIMNDYIFRGVTQSNHKPSVAAYFEPRYNVTKDLQLYRSEEHTSELQSRRDLVCRLLLEKKNIK